MTKHNNKEYLQNILMRIFLDFYLTLSTIAR